VIYLVAALALGVGMLYKATKLIRIADKAAARSVYKYSTAYLAFLFMAMMIDQLVTII
jgi:heme O synthase-like polyprenyltransferase